MLPSEISDDEVVVRVVKTPYHIKKNGTLKPSVFRPRPGCSLVSVIRQCMGDNFCKQKAQEIASESYIGFAAIQVHQIREHESRVLDARGDYLGHAHIDHNISVARDEPLESRPNQMLTRRCQELITFTRFHRDSDPRSSNWDGAPLDAF